MGKSREHTLIVVRRMATEPKTALAGGIFEVLARSKASMAAFKSASRSLQDRLESAFMVERGGCGIIVRCECYEDGSKP